MKVISAYYISTKIIYKLFKRDENKLIEIEKNHYFTGKVSNVAINRFIQKEIDNNVDVLGFEIVSITHPRRIAKFPPSIVKQYTIGG